MISQQFFFSSKPRSTTKSEGSKIMAESVQAKDAPSLNLPKSSNVCHLSIIDTTCEISVPLNMLVEPEIPGYDYLNMPDYSFQ